jgi:hypothetical protein
VGKLQRRRTHTHLASVSVSCDADAGTRAAEIGVIDDRRFENMDGQARVAGWQPVCLRRAREREERRVVGGREGTRNRGQDAGRQAGRQRVRGREGEREMEGERAHTRENRF